MSKHALPHYVYTNIIILYRSPKCRQEYLQSQSPTRYRCFCGKVVDPPHDPWLVPHSCGQQCNKALKPDCGHRCLMLCHPGRYNTL